MFIYYKIYKIDNIKYPPLGKRGVGLSRAQGYGTSFIKYKKWLENDVMIIPQIEHVDAMNNLESILEVPSINEIFIGPYDLSASLGIAGDFKNKLFKEAIKHIEVTCKKRSVKLGIHVVEPNINEIKEKINRGYFYIAYSLDSRLLDTACRMPFQKLKISN